MMYGNILEMFSSIQGEGLLVGCRQVFVRLAGCNLHCRYCDTPESRDVRSRCRIETKPGSRCFFEVDSPLTVDAALSHIKSLCCVRPHSISFTGGEPLMQADFLYELLQQVRNLTVRCYLETNGTLVNELSRLLPLLDVIGMDMKLPSSSNMSCWEQHRAFLKLASSCAVFVKMVVSAGTPLEECRLAAELIKEVDDKIPLIIQPVTSVNPESQVPTPGQMLQLQSYMLEYLEDVRVIPQTHKFMGQL